MTSLTSKRTSNFSIRSSLVHLAFCTKLKIIHVRKSLLNLYFALFYSHLLYCVTIWFSTYQTYAAPISKLQDRAIKLIDGKYVYHYALSSIYKSLHFLQLDDLVKSKLGLFVYCRFKDMLPTPFNNFFVN